MAHKKSAGTTKNGRDSNPKYLGVKIAPGATAKVGQVIIRQRGTDFVPGENTRAGKDHTIFALKDGKVTLSHRRKTHFDNRIIKKKVVNIF